MSDITSHLLYPDDPEYVKKATEYWNALEEDFKERWSKRKAEIVWEHFQGDTGGVPLIKKDKNE